jgi:hypothetical protein
MVNLKIRLHSNVDVSSEDDVMYIKAVDVYDAASVKDPYTGDRH